MDSLQDLDLLKLIPPSFIFFHSLSQYMQRLCKAYLLIPDQIELQSHFITLVTKIYP